MVICGRGANIRDCVVKQSPEHGVYLSGAAYGLQEPTSARITNNHFSNIAKNGIQVQNANACEYMLEGTIITGNMFRNVNVGVFISESYVGLVLKMPITGVPPLGPVKGSTSGAMGHADPGEWEAAPQHHPGWLRVGADAASYPAEFQPGETLVWAGGHADLVAVHYDKVSKLVISSNQFLRGAADRGANLPPAAPIIGVTMGNSSSDLLISSNIFVGMSQQAVEINSSGAINGCSGISVHNNSIDGAGLGGLGVVFGKCDGVSICGNQFRGAPIRSNGNAKNVLIENNMTLHTAVPN
eukprot:SAG22_NODE_6_length_41368_cov_49.702222_23_plen_298_part_00